MNPDDIKIPQLATEIIGMFRIVTTAPAATPRNFADQIVLYTDSLTTPTVFKLYVFMPTINLWKSVTLS